MPWTLPPRRLQPPVLYQGSKYRIAHKLVDQIPIHLNIELEFVDGCCGSGAFAMALLEREIAQPDQITMVDSGPWGWVWEQVGRGDFPLESLRYLIQGAPKYAEQLQSWLYTIAEMSKEIHKKPNLYPNIATYYTPAFLLLQAGANSSLPVRLRQSCSNPPYLRWQHPGFAKHWSTQLDYSGQTTLRPSPMSIYERMARVCDAMYGVQGKWQDIREVVTPQNHNSDLLLYLDPWYRGFKYGRYFAVKKYVESLHVRTMVSSGENLKHWKGCEDTKLLTRVKSSYMLPRVSREEWISKFNWNRTGFKHATLMAHHTD
jgi:hypothetical protein